MIFICDAILTFFYKYSTLIDLNTIKFKYYYI